MIVPFLALGLAAPASALEVRVRAPVRCALDLARSGDGLHLVATVSDDRGRPVAGARVLLDPEGSPSMRGRTDEGGRFTAHLQRARRGQVRLVFHGDERHGGCTLRRAYDTGKRFPRLEVRAPGEVRDGEAARVSVSTDAAAARLQALLWRGDAWREVASGTADGAGRWTFGLDVEAAGGPGPGTLRVMLVADARNNGTAVDRPVWLVRPTALDLAAEDEVSQGDRMRVRGTLSTRRGPVEGALVSLYGDGILLATLRTDRRGGFEARLDLGRGRHRLQASFVPAAPGLGASVSAAVPVFVLPASPLRGLAPALGALLVVLAGVATLVLRRPARPPRAPRAPAKPGPPLAPRTVRRALRRLVPSRVVEGGVWDGVRGGPISGARVRAGTEEALTGIDGRFRLGPLAPGVVVVLALAPGYAPEERSTKVPARDDLWIELFPWREKILRAYGEAAARFLPGPPLGERTPAELRRDAAGLPPEARTAFAELTDLVHEACYSPRPGGADAWAAASQILARLSRTPRA